MKNPNHIAWEVEAWAYARKFMAKTHQAALARKEGWAPRLGRLAYWYAYECAQNDEMPLLITARTRLPIDPEIISALRVNAVERKAA